MLNKYFDTIVETLFKLILTKVVTLLANKLVKKGENWWSSFWSTSRDEDETVSDQLYEDIDSQTIDNRSSHCIIDMEPNIPKFPV